MEYKYINQEGAHGYMVEKSQLQKLRDHSIRILATPITVVVDCAPLVVCLVAFFTDYGHYTPFPCNY